MAHTSALPAGLKIFDLTGRVALVTGAGRGLGRAMAIALASVGANVVLASRTTSELESAAADVEAQGAAALSIPTDVTHQSDVEALVDQAVQHFGKIDILVNNAGI